MRNRQLHILPYVIFFLLSLAPFYWMPQVAGKQFLGAGDYLSPFSIPKELHNLFYVYDKSIFGGIDASLNLATIVPVWVIMWIADHLGAGPLIGTIAYIAEILLIAQASAYIWLKYFLGTEKRFVYTFLGAVLYGFSSYILPVIAPGQMGNIFLYAFLPLIMFLTDRMVHSHTLEWKMVLALFFVLSLFTDGASYGFGPLYVITWVIIPYCSILLLLNFSHGKRILKRLVVIMFLLIAANIYWILPWLFTGFGQTSVLASKVISSGINVASRFSSVPNLFLGKTESWWYQLDRPSFPITIIYILLTVGFIGGLILSWKNLRTLSTFAMILFSAFITKGTNPPFAGLFLWLYNTVPGFTVFRRPVNKFYGTFLLFLITAGLAGLLAFEKKFPKYRHIIRTTFLIVLSAGALYSIILVAQIKDLTAFSVPGYYQEAWDYVSKDSVSRVIVLPGLNGVQPTFNSGMNGYYGFDPLYKIWDTSIVVPDFTDYSPPYPIKNRVNAVIASILKSEKFCQHARETGVSHILLREDLAKNITYAELPTETYLNAVMDSTDWVNKQHFGPEGSGIFLFPVREECRSPRISVTSQDINTAYTAETVSPVKYIIRVKDSDTSLTIRFLDNYSRWWYLLPGDLSRNSWGRDMMLLTHALTRQTNHRQEYGWANVWDITPEKDSGQTGTVVYTLFYLPQSAVYAGILLWLGTLISLIVYPLIVRK
jgi:hypothetical protein